jgi:hypothetical protein
VDSGQRIDLMIAECGARRTGRTVARVLM